MLNQLLSILPPTIPRPLRARMYTKLVQQMAPLTRHSAVHSRRETPAVCAAEGQAVAERPAAGNGHDRRCTTSLLDGPGSSTAVLVATQS